MLKNCQIFVHMYMGLFFHLVNYDPYLFSHLKDLWFCSRIFQAAFVNSLVCLCPKPEAFEISWMCHWHLSRVLDRHMFYQWPRFLCLRLSVLFIKETSLLGIQFLLWVMVPRFWYSSTKFIANILCVIRYLLNHCSSACALPTELRFSMETTTCSFKEINHSWTLH